MANYARITGKTRKTAGMTKQTKAIVGRETEMEKNPAGGVSFKLDDFARLQRFIILGVEGNSYYQSQKILVNQNVDALERCLIADGKRVVDMVVDIATNGRAFKQDAGLFVLAAAASFKGGSHNTRKNPPNRNRFQYEENYEKALAEYEASKLIVSDAAALEVRQYALEKLPLVARTGTALYTFAEFVRGQRGFGRSLRRAFAKWMTDKPLDKLAYQAWKYKSRNGWTYRDIMRLAHPVTDQRDRAAVFHYMAKGELPEDASLENAALAQIDAAEHLLKIMNGREKVTKDVIGEATKLITDHRLTHEAVPSELRKSPEIWEALLQDMPLQAAVSNLGVMTSAGLVKPLSGASKKIIGMLGNAEAIERSRMHPMRFFIAAKVYGMGRGIKGSLSWSPDQGIMDALDEAYYAAFGNVESTGKSVVIAVDDSGSMGGRFYGFGGQRVVGTVPNTSPAEVAAAMALVTYRVEPNSVLIGYSDGIREMKVSRRARIDGIVKHIGRGGGTNTSLPVQYAMKNNLDVDGIVSYTDNNTWGAGSWGWNREGHVTEWVKKYVDRYGPMRFVNVAFESNGITDVDPNNPHMFELTGCDANTPRIISEYLAGNL